MIDWNALIKDFSDSQLKVGEIIRQHEGKRRLEVRYIPSTDSVIVWNWDQQEKNAMDKYIKIIMRD